MVMKILFRGIILIVISLLFSCEQKPSVIPGIESQESLDPVTVPRFDEAVITFISGDASVLRNDAWLPADIGDKLVRNDTISVEEDSYCEIQIGEKAVVHVEENTTLAMETLLMKEGETDVGIEVVLGSVLFKVEKLTEKEDFRVNTPSSACGVRGTIFMIKESEDEGTLLAVKEGKVAILPAGVGTREMRNKVKERETMLSSIIDTIENTAPVIEGGSEILITREAAMKGSTEFREFEYAFEKAVQEDGIDESMLEALEKNGKKIVATVVETMDKPSQITRENVVLFDKVEKVPIHNLGTEEKKKAAPQVVKVVIKTSPGQAEIVINNTSFGYGKVSGLFPPGERLTIKVRLAGYEEKEITITPVIGRDARYTIHLEKIKETDDEETTEVPAMGIEETIHEDMEEKEIESKNITLTVTPDDADIILDGKKVGKGTYKAAFNFGEDVEFVIERKGYKTGHYSLHIDEGTKATHAISLKARGVMQTISAAFSSVVGHPCVYEDRIIVADTYGVLAAVTLDGEKAWSVSTDNQSNTNSAPVVIGSRVYFSGSGEFVIVDIDSGRVVKRRTLDNASSHLFGRRVVSYGNMGIYPENERLVLFDLGSGETIRTIPIPGESRMSPAVYNNMILISDLEGKFLMIDAGTGNVVSSIKTSLTMPVAIAITVHGTSAFIAGRKGMVACIDLNKKEVVWETLLSDDKQAAVYHDMIFGNNTLFVFSRGTLYALSAATGKPLYGEIRGLSCPPAYIGGSIVIGLKDKTVKALNPVTGKRKASFDAGDEITARPVLYKEKIIAGTASGKVLIIDSDDLR
jgi:outer membrane protein assembly factor BamB